MRQFCSFLVVGAMFLAAGCSSDIVCTQEFKTMPEKCVCIQAFESEDPHVGEVMRDVLEKEFVRRRLNICDEGGANVFITGSTFMTERGGSKFTTNEAIESVSLVARDQEGNVLMSASYDNKDQLSVSKLAKDFGTAVAGKF